MSGNEEANNSYRISFAELKAFAQNIFKNAGLSDLDAERIADALVTTDLRGVTSHGVIRLPFYVKRLLKGGAKAHPEIKIVKEGISFAVVDGDNGLGHIIGIRCMEIAIEKAKHSGIACVVARNSDHIGALAYFSMMALKENMIGMTWTNGYPGMAPWGGRESKICNNPIAVAVPAAKRDPIVLDMATSVVAGGKVRVAAKKGERIPKGWIIDKHGKHTENPNDLFGEGGGGAVLPIGYKGYGLAVIGEILSGALSGGRILDEIPLFFTNLEKPVGNGHFHIAIDISKFCDVEAFKARVDQIADILKATPLMDGYNEILVAGEPEERKAKEQRRDGILVHAAIVRDLNSLAQELRVEVPDSLRQTA